MRRVLVTGGAGFAARYLIRELVDNGNYLVTAVGKSPRPDHWPAGVDWIQADLSNEASVATIPRNWWAVFHLAAISVPAQVTSEQQAMQNVRMTTLLLEHLERTRVLLTSSPHVYAPDKRPHKEDEQLAPLGLYGRSKLLCEQAVLERTDRHDGRIARPFNHLGRGMDPALAVPTVITKVNNLPPQGGVIRLRGCNSIRDFLDVRDIVRGYRMLVERDAPGPRIFNVCSGVATAIRDLVEIALSLSGKQAQVEFESARIAADDVDTLIGDPSRIEAMTGWTRRIALQDSIAHMLGPDAPSNASLPGRQP